MKSIDIHPPVLLYVRHNVTDDGDITEIVDGLPFSLSRVLAYVDRLVFVSRNTKERRWIRTPKCPRPLYFRLQATSVQMKHAAFRESIM